MKLMMCKQMMTLGLALLVLAALARLAPLLPAARMADNLALIASGLLVVLTAIVGWHERRRDQDTSGRAPARPAAQPVTARHHDARVAGADRRQG